MKVFGYIALLLCLPFVAHADVLITEIMYAPEGADATHEWVEVCNTGADTQDIENWKFFENDTNHGLTLQTGVSELSNGECAILADNASVFLTDYVSFSGNLFDSAFSLKNTGETLALKDEINVIVDSVSYTDADGAKDDGLSLHRSGTTLSASAPTPGTEAGVDSGEDTSESQASNSSEGAIVSTTSYKYESVTIQPPQDVYLRVPEHITTTVGAITVFEVESFDATGKALDDGVVYWAFGDGAKAMGREVGHRFLYEGTYTVSVVLTRGSLSDEKQIVVTVVPLEAEVHVEENGEWVTIVNNGTYPLDLSNWRLVSSGQYFSIPEHTLIQAGTEVRLASEITKLSTLKAVQQVTLVYPDGKVALESSDTGRVEKDESEEIVVDEIITPLTLAPVQRAASIIGLKLPSNPIEKSSTEAIEAQKEAEEVSASNMLSTSTQAAALIIGANKVSKGTDIYWYLGLGLLILFAISGILLMQPRKLIVDGFEVVESKD